MSMYDFSTPISEQSPLTGGLEYPAGYDPGSGVYDSAGTSAQGNMMAAGMFLNMFSSISGSIMQSNALNAQAKFQQQQFNFNAGVAELQAQAALADGEKQAEQIERAGNQAVGQERASAGAAGIEVNSGSAMDVQTTSKTMSAMDALTARNNAARAAWGYKVQAINNTTQGAYAAVSASNQASTTLLTGGINATAYGAQGYYYGTGGKISDSRTTFKGN